METQEFSIVTPEGYEIDKENSTFEKIVFKKKDDKPRSWEEFCKRGFTGEEGFFNIAGVIKTSSDKGYHRDPSMVCYVDNVQEGKAFISLMQLRQLRKAWVGDWEPDWKSADVKYTIEYYCDAVRIGNHIRYSKPMSFPTEKNAEEFLKCFKDLLEQAKMLL